MKFFIPNVLIVTLLFLMVSCGNGDKGNASNYTRSDEEQLQQEQQEDQGFYRVILSSLNSNVAGETTGTVEIRITGDDLVAKSNIANAPAGVKHLQNITTLTSCPSVSADVNGDGYLDFLEVIPSTGPILIPLDSDLSQQLDGIDYGPISNSIGVYSYRRSTTLSMLLADLRAPDPDPADLIVKLTDGENLNLAGRVVLIHGVSALTNLPDSVFTIREQSRELLLPIACGKIVRVSNEDLPPVNN